MKRNRLVYAAGAAVAATMLVAAPSALAGTLSHTDVTVDGSKTPADQVNVSGANDKDLHFETDSAGVPMDCETANVDGYVERGESVDVGNQIGAITDLAFDDCEVSGSLPVIVEDNPGEWPITVRNHPSNADDPVDITIEGVSAYMHSTGSTPWACELDATGDVNGTFYPGTTSNGHDGRIEIDTTAGSGNHHPLNVDAYDGSGNKSSAGTTCVLINNDDGVSMTGDFEIDVDADDPGENPISHQ